MSTSARNLLNMAPKVNPEQYQQMLQRLVKAEENIKQLENSKKDLEKRVEVLEAKVVVAENTSEKLRLELDRVDQYQRRSNVLLKFADLPKNNNEAKDKELVKNVLEKELKIANCLSTIDKMHRVGKVRTRDGKQNQDIIVRFKTHHSRYTVMRNRKEAKSAKIRPNLTKYRNDLRYNASELVKNIEGVKFVYANIHGDLILRLNEEIDGEEDFQFNSMEKLKSLLVETGCVEDDEDNDE